MVALALEPGYKVLALKLQEAAMMHGDVRSRLHDAVNDAHRAAGTYGGYIDHSGDGESGDVVYSSNGDIRKAPYEIGTVGGKATANIDTENSKSVVPMTTYQEEAEDEDHYAAMGESFKASKLYAALPVYERFIPKKTRDTASGDSFAGKGRSFPILKAEDVSAALHSIGRAGADNYSSDTIRSNIKRIAKAKGFALPDSLKDDSARETVSRETVESPTLNNVLIEFRLAEIADLKEAAEYPVKLMSAGRGSSGYYPESVVKRDGPAIFKKDTQMFWNHATDAEESDRPEGNLDHLAAVLTSDAAYQENGKDGPGLYATAKVFGPYVDKVREMGKHIGLSIRAGGSRDDAAKGPDGKPGVITALRQAQSVDFVTKAGRDGKIFTEAATAAKGDEMELAEVQKLIEAAVNPLKAENTRLNETLRGFQLRETAPQMIHEALEPLRLPAASKRKLFEKYTSASVTAILPLKDGALDKDAIGKLVEADAIREANFLVELGYGDSIAAMGQPLTEKDIKESAEAVAKDHAEMNENLADIFVGPKLVTGNPEAMALREAARKAIIQGRAA